MSPTPILATCLISLMLACGPTEPETSSALPPLGKADGVGEQSCRALLSEPVEDCCDSPDPFGREPICYDDPTALGVWHRIICQLVETHVGTDHFAEAWDGILSPLAGESLGAQLRAINDFVNDFEYREDPESSTEVDSSWGTSAGNLLAEGGDCEDFALVKYLALRELGLPACRMRIAQGYSADYRANHAVLVVMDDNGRSWVLDNARAEIEKVERYVDGFTVVATVNEANGWLYMP